MPPEGPRWIVASRDVVPLGHAKFAVWKAFGCWPADDDLEVVQDAPVIPDARLYVIDRHAIEEVPEMGEGWLRVG